MTAKETLDAIEDTLDVVEDVLDSIDDPIAYISNLKKIHRTRLAVLLPLAAVSGGVAAYFLAKKHLTAKYESIAKQEIEESKEFYSRLYKKDEFATPESAVQAVGAEAAADALAQYQGHRVVEEVVEVEAIPVTTHNVFTNPVPDEISDRSVWDLEEEIKTRTDDEPYVISSDEFNENERDYEQLTLSYYAEDDVLLDQDDKPIEEVDSVVGEGNLLRFGHGSHDNRIVFVRNDKLSMDFSVVKYEGSYAKEVLGFQHSDKSRGVPRFRRGDDD